MAQQFDADPQATTLRSVTPLTDTLDQLDPFQPRSTPAELADVPGPTAQQIDADAHATESRPGADGSVVVVQADPSQATAKALGPGLPPPADSVPTAQQLVAEVQATLPRAVESYGEDAAGIEASDQLVPFHSIAKSRDVVDCHVPTIQQSSESAQESAGDPVKLMVPLAGFGTLACVQTDPFHERAITCSPELG